MGRIVLAALVGIWLFNLARLIAGGLPGYAPVESAAAYAAPSPAATAELRAPARARPAEVAISLRSARATPDAPGSVSVGVVLSHPAVVYLDLVDATGRHSFTKTSRRLPAGSSRIQLHSIERLSEGTYWIRAQVGNRVATTSVAIHG